MGARVCALARASACAFRARAARQLSAWWSGGGGSGSNRRAKSALPAEHCSTQHQCFSCQSILPSPHPRRCHHHITSHQVTSQHHITSHITSHHISNHTTALQTSHHMNHITSHHITNHITSHHITKSAIWSSVHRHVSVLSHMIAIKFVNVSAFASKH